MRSKAFGLRVMHVGVRHVTVPGRRAVDSACALLVRDEVSNMQTAFRMKNVGKGNEGMLLLAHETTCTARIGNDDIGFCHGHLLSVRTRKECATLPTARVAACSLQSCQAEFPLPNDRSPR